MNVPVGSLNGPKRSGVWQPMTSSNQLRASAMSGTVMPTWSMPRTPGIAWS